MAFGKKFDKNKSKDKRKQQNPLFKRKKFCRFTVANVEQIDYKDIDTLKDFIQENCKIMPARLTGSLCHLQRCAVFRSGGDQGCAELPADDRL